MTWKRTLSIGVSALLVLGAGSAWYLAQPAPYKYEHELVKRATALDGWHPTWEAEPADSKPGRHPEKWIVLGWDGASWDIILPLIERGHLPNLAAMMRRGAFGNLFTFKPTLSAAVWTTIATGVSPKRHGIMSFTRPNSRLEVLLRDRFGRRPQRELCTNSDRKVRALWNIASDWGKRVMVVGYHNTFPAEKVNGLMVSNYLVRRHPLERLKENPGASDDPLVYPPSAASKIVGLARHLEDVPWDEFQPLANIDHQKYRRIIRRVKHGGLTEQRWLYLLRYYEYDAFQVRVTLAMHDEIDPDFLMLHLQSIDGASHRFLWLYAPDWFGPLPPAGGHGRRRFEHDRRYFGKTVAAFYENADRILGKLLEKRDANTGVMILSDHGFEADTRWMAGSHEAGPPGILVVDAPGVRAGHVVKEATVYDILPTLVASAGLPVARDLEGHALREMWSADSFPEVRWVDSYESGEHYVADVNIGSELNKEVQDELRELGYLDAEEQ